MELLKLIDIDEGMKRKVSSRNRVIHQHWQISSVAMRFWGGGFYVDLIVYSLEE